MSDEKEQLEERAKQYLAGLDHGYILAAEKPELIEGLKGVFDSKTAYGKGFLKGIIIGKRRRDIYLRNFTMNRGKSL